MSPRAKFTAEETKAPPDAEAPPPGTDGSRLILTQVSTVPRRPIRWAWPGYLAYGKITLFAGDPDNGKSFAVVDLAARFTAGGTWPDGTPIGGPGQVLLFSAEDDVGDTIRPRLEQAGGDPERLYTAEEVIGPTGRRELFTLHHTTALRAALLETDAKLCVIDPSGAYLGETDGDSNPEMRALLRPLAMLAAERDVVLIVISHLNKTAAIKALYRVQGSIGLVGAVRLAYVFTRGLAEDQDTRYVGKLKANITKAPPPLAFRFSETTSTDEVPRILWDPAPVMRHTIEELLRGEAPAPPRGTREPSPDQQAEQRTGEAFLEIQLAHGPAATKALQAAAKGAGIGWRSVVRAKARAGDQVRAEEFRAPDGQVAGWYWYRAEHAALWDALRNGHATAPPPGSREEAGALALWQDARENTHESARTSHQSATAPGVSRAPGRGVVDLAGRRKTPGRLHEAGRKLALHLQAGPLPWPEARTFLQSHGLTPRAAAALLDTEAGNLWAVRIEDGQKIVAAP